MQQKCQAIKHVLKNVSWNDLCHLRQYTQPSDKHKILITPITPIWKSRQFRRYFSHVYAILHLAGKPNIRWCKTLNVHWFRYTRQININFLTLSVHQHMICCKGLIPSFLNVWTEGLISIHTHLTEIAIWIQLICGLNKPWDTNLYITMLQWRHTI
jgi:hypothetical protein